MNTRNEEWKEFPDLTMDRVREEWQARLEDIREKFPSLLLRWLPLRVTFLPKWWPKRYTYFSVLGWIFVGPGFRDAPKYVPPWVLGHEYGHVAKGDALPALVALPLFVTTCFVNLPLLSLVALMLLIKPVFGKIRAEHQADDMAVKVCDGKALALVGSLWCAQKNGTMGQSSRQERLARLGWDGK